eukprot:Skav205595  [mRNA]  locus=scaffold460:127731:128837:- [translate_table: standard]
MTLNRNTDDCSGSDSHSSLTASAFTASLQPLVVRKRFLASMDDQTPPAASWLETPVTSSHRRPQHGQ